MDTSVGGANWRILAFIPGVNVFYQDLQNQELRSLVSFPDP